MKELSVPTVPIIQNQELRIRRQGQTMGINAEQCETRHYLSLGGTSPLALLRFLKDQLEINQVILSLDNDKAIRRGTRKIMEAIRNDAVLASQVAETTDKPPSFGKDYNELLQHILEEQRSITAPSRHKQAAVSL